MEEGSFMCFFLSLEELARADFVLGVVVGPTGAGKTTSAS